MIRLRAPTEGETVVEDAVLLRDVTVRAGGVVRRAIVDEASEISGTVDGGRGQIAVIPGRTRLKAGQRVTGAPRQEEGGN